MRRRVPPSADVKQELAAVLDQGTTATEHPLDQFIRLGTRYVLQVAFEQEVTEWLGFSRSWRA